MDALHWAHLAALGAWALLVLFEGVLELGATDDAARRRTARAHYWLDVIVEIPLLLAVLATGALLTMRAWPPGERLVLKIGCALLAIGVNAYCAVHVILRYRRRDDAAALAYHGRRVRLSGLGLPPALIAAYIGLAPLLGVFVGVAMRDDLLAAALR